MKTLGLAILVFAGSTALPAQTAVQIKADIPFAFEMADRKLPAGEYVVNGLTGARVFTISNTERTLLGVSRGIVLDNGIRNGMEAKLVFNKYGDRYFLSQVLSPNSSEQLTKSKSERMLVTSTLITANQREQVVILARAF